MEKDSRKDPSIFFALMHRISFSIPWPLSTDAMREILSFAFLVTLMTYFGMMVLEIFWPGFVTQRYSLTSFFWLTIATGFLSALWPIVTTPAKRTMYAGWRSFALLAVLSVVGGLTVYAKVKSFGWVGVVIALLTALAVPLLVMLVYIDRETSRR